VKHETVRKEIRAEARALVEGMLMDVAEYVCGSCPAYRYTYDCGCWECVFGCEFGDGQPNCMNSEVVNAIFDLEDHIVDCVNEALDMMK